MKSGQTYNWLHFGNEGMRCAEQRSEIPRKITKVEFKRKKEKEKNPLQYC